MKNKDLKITKCRKYNRGYLHRSFNLYPGHDNGEVLTFFSHNKMIVGVHIDVNDKYWNGEKEVLLDAVYKGFHYRLGLDNYKSERSLVLRINIFIKYILNATP